ncbi:MAG: glycoside hydrolase family 15 protein [Acidobacteriota bacterium]
MYRFRKTARPNNKGKYILPFYFLLFAAVGCAQTLAPGGPGKDAFWSTAGKQAIGTSATLESKVWFTLAQGVMTEVYYPNVTVANVQTLQFVVVDPKTKKVETERDDSTSTIKPEPVSNSKNLSPIEGIYIGSHYWSSGSLAFEQTTTSRSSEWWIEKRYITDPMNSTVLLTVKFNTKNPDLELYVYYDPSLANTGMHDSGWFDGRTFYSVDGQIASALTCGRCTLVEPTSGFFGVSDGLTQLRKDGKITQSFSRAENGNIVQVAKVLPVALAQRREVPEMVFALGFGSSPAGAFTAAQSSLTKGFGKTHSEYQSGWADYLRGLPKVDPKYQAHFNMAAMVLKAQEDKTVRGANVASLTVPWGGGMNANEDVGGGYHLVWARDLYHVFTAYMALGDKAAAERALDFLFNIQQKDDGSFPQNSWLDGKRGWGSLQMDEVGYPLIMAWQLGRFDKPTYEKHVKRAADFIVKNGPKTPQERWEEEAGFSPSTIAAEIAGLVCAADIAKKNSDEASAIIYLATADDWARNIERMTATTTGPYGDGNYYLRITQNANPDSGDKIELNNGAGTVDERTVVDAGFLELVRLGIKPANDPLIAKSVKVIDEQIMVETPNGETFYRYSKDGYGEMDDGRRWNYDGTYTGKGRPWPLLTGERGQYEIAECGMRNAELPDRTSKAERRSVGGVFPTANAQCLAAARSRLNAMLAFANEGLMIPEQVWDKKEIPAKIDSQYIPPLKFGEGTGSATPLAWSMGQFIRLATNLKAVRNLDTPQVVYDRYVLGKR